ncbi:MAG: exonuclease SbcD [Planctomycetota bacterium]|jgi:exonuclease SbcD
MAERKDAELLFIGDVHLGRRPVGMDAALLEHGLTARELSPAVALTNVVDHALESPPRVVIFAGDLVDHDDDYFEASFLLEREVKRLVEAGIAVVAIAGNHDGNVLPKLIKQVEGVRLLGAGGTWERFEVPGSGRPIDLLGWSFPKRHFSNCPLDHGEFTTAKDSTRSGAKVIGVLHTDLDAGSSNYAPVSRSRLVDTNLDAWFLGHIHQPGDLDEAVPIGYLGSLVGLDPGEPGLRGAWRVSVAGDRVVAKQLSLEPVRFEYLEVPLTDKDCDDVESVHSRVMTVVREWVAASETLNLDTLQALIVRVNLTGELPDCSAPREYASGGGPRNLNAGELRVVIQKSRDETTLVIDLETLALEPTPLGYVAQRVLDLRAGNQLATASGAQAEINDLVAMGWDLDEEDYPVPSAKDMLERSARRVLSTLLAQREEVQS